MIWICSLESKDPINQVTPSVPRTRFLIIKPGFSIAVGPTGTAPHNLLGKLGAQIMLHCVHDPRITIKSMLPLDMKDILM